MSDPAGQIDFEVRHVAPARRLAALRRVFASASALESEGLQE